MIIIINGCTDETTGGGDTAAVIDTKAGKGTAVIVCSVQGME